MVHMVEFLDRPKDIKYSDENLALAWKALHAELIFRGMSYTLSDGKIL